MSSLDRRALILGGSTAALTLALAGCADTGTPAPVAAAPAAVRSSAPVAITGLEPKYSALYGEVTTEPHPVPAIKASILKPAFVRKLVPYETKEPPGTIVIDPHAHYLYFVQADGMALRYGVGVGREGFAWKGEAVIKTKQEWPDWYPPKEMIDRTPGMAEKLDTLQSGIGMHGGAGNPLGARAMYLWQGNKDTLFRIHGTTEPKSIGTSASSGCIRMINQDAIDLYGRVPEGTRVVVL
ncbi:MAG: L,D-transpeptidase [Beijerinckiaceae bacterium]|nr:L,D-transpeptidase [Beijerinckiaceae bacterium]